MIQQAQQLPVLLCFAHIKGDLALLEHSMSFFLHLQEAAAQDMSIN
jgi:hypothetical protein